MLQSIEKDRAQKYSNMFTAHWIGYLAMKMDLLLIASDIMIGVCKST